MQSERNILFTPKLDIHIILNNIREVIDVFLQGIGVKDREKKVIIMIVLDTFFSKEEKNTLQKWAGDAYEVLSCIEGESYILNNIEGTYQYNECFHPTDERFFARQKYEKVIPYRIIRFNQFYLMNTKEEENIWYRGRRDVSGNWEYICYSDSLEEAFSFL